MKEWKDVVMNDESANVVVEVKKPARKKATAAEDNIKHSLFIYPDEMVGLSLPFPLF